MASVRPSNLPRSVSEAVAGDGAEAEAETEAVAEAEVEG
jgi:hypothetical protein